MNNPYNEIDNLSAFTHPIFNQKFKYMNDYESIDMAKTILNKFIESGFKNVIVIESGTSPLIHIIKKLSTFNKNDLNLFQIKIPRDLDFNLYGWFKTYLSENELKTIVNINGNNKTRNEFLKTECDNFNLKDFVGNNEFKNYDSINDNNDYNLELVLNFQNILNGTELHNIFKSEFLLFDEYINAGTIIRNFNGIAKLFTNTPKFKLSAFCIFVDNINKYPKIAFSLFDKRTELECYQKGAYPFENRVDLIGYYYFINQQNFNKIYINDLITTISKNNELDVNAFYDNVLLKIVDNKLLETFKNNLSEEQVKNYVTNYDLMRYLMKYLEKIIYGETLYYDLFDQVFEIYAPAWSPMPVKNHLDYWNGFDAINQQINLIALDLLQRYKIYRFNIIDNVLNILINNRNIWLNNIENILKEEV